MEVKLLTKLFKSMVVLIDLINAFVKFGIESPLFLEVYKKNESYMMKEPPCTFIVPAFMSKGAFVQIVDNEEPDGFWKNFTKPILMQNGYSEEEVEDCIRQILVKKILSITTKKNDAVHAELRSFFKTDRDAVMDSALTSDQRMQVNAVAFVAWFGAGGDPDRLARAKAIIDNPVHDIANTLKTFPSGKGIIASANEKGKKAGTKAKQLAITKDAFATMVDNYPAASSVDAFKGAADQMKIYFAEVDLSDDQAKIASTETFKADLQELEKKVDAQFNGEICPFIIQLDGKPDEAINPEDLLKVINICRPLIELDPVQKMSGGRLMSTKLTTFRQGGELMMDTMCSLAQASDAIDGEHLDEKMASQIFKVGKRLNAEYLEGAFGKVVDWPGFIKKIISSRAIVKSIAILNKVIMPRATSLMELVGKIIDIQDVLICDPKTYYDFGNIDTTKGINDHESIQIFANDAQDLILRKQSFIIDLIFQLYSSMKAVRTWWDGGDHSLMQPGRDVMSKLRGHIRSAQNQKDALGDTFKEHVDDGTHLVTIFDKTDLGDKIGSFISEAIKMRDTVQDQWKTMLIKLKHDVHGAMIRRCQRDPH